jgi:ATP/maltotriose-dependent transcriptional regulator MalT
MLLSMNHKFMRQFEAAERAVRALAEEIERLGQVAQAAQPLFFRGCLSLHAGRLDDAAAEAQDGLTLSEELGGHGSDLAGLCVLALVSVRRGDIEAARGYVQRCRTLHSERDILYGAAWGRWARTVVAEAAGGVDGAVDVLRAAYTDGREQRWTLLVEPIAAAWMTRVALAAGNRPYAEKVVDTADALAWESPDFPVLAVAAAHARGVLGRDPGALRRAAADHYDPWGRASAAETSASCCSRTTVTDPAQPTTWSGRSRATRRPVRCATPPAS